MVTPKEAHQAARRGSTEHRELNDCAVIALALATGTDYAKTHATLKANGRPDRKGTPWIASARALRDLGFRAEGITDFGRRMQNGRLECRARTVASIPSDPYFTKGTFLVNVRGHILCVVDGQVLDWTDGRRHRIVAVWRVVPIMERPAPTVETVTQVTEFCGPVYDYIADVQAFINRPDYRPFILGA